MQDFELESFLTGGEHSQMVKAPPVKTDYGSKDCVNLPSSTAVFRFKAQKRQFIEIIPNEEATARFWTAHAALNKNDLCSSRIPGNAG